jgi:hypothetical protein
MTERSIKVVWTVSINRTLAERIVRNLPRDDFDGGGPKKGSRSQLIEGLLKQWVDQVEQIAPLD